MRTVCLIVVLVVSLGVCAFPSDAGQSGTVGAAAASLTNVRQQKTQVHEFLITAPDAKPEQRSLVITSEQPIRLSPGTLAPFDNTCYRIQAFKVRRIDNSDSTEPAGQTTCVYRNQVQMKNAAGSNSNK